MTFFSMSRRREARDLERVLELSLQEGHAVNLENQEKSSLADEQGVADDAHAQEPGVRERDKSEQQQDSRSQDGSTDSRAMSENREIDPGEKDKPALFGAHDDALSKTEARQQQRRASAKASSSKVRADASDSSQFDSRKRFYGKCTWCYLRSHIVPVIAHKCDKSYAGSTAAHSPSASARASTLPTAQKAAFTKKRACKA